jgi:sterol desaturase/sphingolipid hydroxylase (fatty acid hydroxylase superfamily)
MIAAGCNDNPRKNLTPDKTLDALQQLESAVLWGGLLLLIIVETLAPRERRVLRQRAAHALRNTSIWLIALVLVSVLFGAALGGMLQWLAQHRVGLLYALDAPLWLAAPVGFLLLDFADYVLHRLSHSLRPLWLLHSVHHSDSDLDITTNLRHHPLHVICTVGWKILAFAAVGAPLAVFLAHEIVVIAVAQMHHAAIRWSPQWDRWLSWLSVSPRGHWVHHSPEPERTNANFGATLSWWDRLAGTYMKPGDDASVFGLALLNEPRWHSPKGMLMTPLWARRLGEL